jgi:acetyl esterase/lipase
MGNHRYGREGRGRARAMSVLQLAAALTLCTNATAGADGVASQAELTAEVRLWPGEAPGSEIARQVEKSSTSPFRMVRNVADGFLAYASDDSLIAPHVRSFYEALRDAGQHPELHGYRSGGHGIGLRKQGKSSDYWIDDFHHWLESLDLGARFQRNHTDAASTQP